jgi:hypothetical protein
MSVVLERIMRPGRSKMRKTSFRQLRQTITQNGSAAFHGGDSASHVREISANAAVEGGATSLVLSTPLS